MFKVSQFDPRVLSWWRTQRQKLDMEPAYQRHGRLWSSADKAFLIDSILNDYDIPKIYVADFTFGNTALNPKRLSYAIIDGKQRFEAVFDFYDGKITLNEDFTFLENPALDLRGLSYSDLRKNYPEVADKFDNFHLSVMRVIADREEPINELFVRLNRSKPLTGAEIRNAMAGPAPKVIRQIAAHEFFTSYVKFTSTRGQDKNTAAKLLLFEYEDDLKETKRSNLDAFVRHAEQRGKARLELAGRRVVEILADMTTVFLPRDTLLSSAGILPVYYWFVRERKPEHLPHVRRFLIDFERDRRLNREKFKNKVVDSEIDKHLLDFDSFNRSTNDLRSHVGRFDILVLRFHAYLRAAGVSKVSGGGKVTSP